MDRRGGVAAFAPLLALLAANLAQVEAAFGGLRLRSSPHALAPASGDDMTPASVSFPHFLMRKMADECECTLASPCGCDTSMDFMRCVKNACESGKCGCEGNNEFFDSCQQASHHCPEVGLTCVKPLGTATCPRSGMEPLQVAMTPVRTVPPSTTKAPETTKPVPTTTEAPQKIETGVFPVPTASRCVVIMCCHYMLIFVALAKVRTYHELTVTAGGRLLRALRAGATTVAYGPMLCVLFIACRMRVEFLSGGKDQPQQWVQNCMYATTFAVIATTLVVLLPALIGGKPVPVTKDGKLQKPTGGGTVFYVMTAIRYAIQLGLYGGIAGIMVGIFVYTPPGVTDVTSLPPPAPAVMCTMILTVLFFTAHLAVAVLSTYSELTGTSTNQLMDVMTTASDTVNFAPMLSILFLAARMRALQHDGQPQAWAQNCMYASTCALAVTTILSVSVPLALGGDVEVDPTTSQTTYMVKDKKVALSLDVTRYAVMVGMYGGAMGVIVSIYKFESPKGPEHTVAVSPTVQCVVNLCFQYFLIYAMLNVSQSLQEFSKPAKRAAEAPLSITFIQATGLKHLNFLANGLQATCTVKQKFEREVVGPRNIKTTVVSKTDDPFWNETYEMGWARGDDLEFAVVDIGLLDKKLEGKVVLPSEVFYPKGFVGDVPLSGVPNAKLNISIMVKPQKETNLQRFSRAVDAAKATVTFAPMLCILFVATRMYALLITNNKGAPQAWVQDGMYMSTWALFISFVMCMVSTALVDNVNMDDDGNVVSGFRNKYLGIAVTAVRYLTMILLYGGIITVIVGIFVMTPETANGRGAVPVVSDAVNTTPMGKPPPSPDAAMPAMVAKL